MLSHRHWTYKGTNSINPPTSQSHKTGLRFSPASTFGATAFLFPVAAEVEPPPTVSLLRRRRLWWGPWLFLHMCGNNGASVVDLAHFAHSSQFWSGPHPSPSGWLYTANPTPLIRCPLKPFSIQPPFALADELLLMDTSCGGILTGSSTSIRAPIPSTPTSSLAETDQGASIPTTGAEGSVMPNKAVMPKRRSCWTSSAGSGHCRTNHAPHQGDNGQCTLRTVEVVSVG